MEALQRKMMASMLDDIENLEKGAESGELQGGWRLEPIEKPGMKGFILHGSFSTPKPLDRPRDILPPLRPRSRSPRDPLYDITTGKAQLEIYVELPGVEENEIQLDAEPRRLEVKAKDFQTEIDLSGWILDFDAMTTEYRNGVLKIIIPRKELDEQLI